MGGPRGAAGRPKIDVVSPVGMKGDGLDDMVGPKCDGLSWLSCAKGDGLSFAKGANAPSKVDDLDALVGSFITKSGSRSPDGRPEKRIAGMESKRRGAWRPPRPCSTGATSTLMLRRPCTARVKPNVAGQFPAAEQ